MRVKLRFPKILYCMKNYSSWGPNCLYVKFIVAYSTFYLKVRSCFLRKPDTRFSTSGFFMNHFPLGPEYPISKTFKYSNIQNFVYILAVQKHYMSVNSNPSASQQQQNMKKLRWYRLHRWLTLTFEYIRELLYKFKIAPMTNEVFRGIDL